MNFKKYKLVIIDLDNTLYEEQIYLFGAYEEISNYLSRKYKSLLFFDIYNFLKSEYLINGRKLLLNKLFDKYFINNEMSNCLDILRSVKLKNKINLTEKGSYLLRKALSESRVVILTNGNIEQQKNKINQINWSYTESDFEIIYANKYSPKPSVDVYVHYIKDKYKINSKETIMIGDHTSDELFAKNINCDFININKINHT